MDKRWPGNISEDIQGMDACGWVIPATFTSTEKGKFAKCRAGAHVRRYFIRAEEKPNQKSQPKRSKESGNCFRSSERQEIRELPSEQRLELRKQYSAVIAEELFAWLATKQLEVLPKSPMGEAIALRAEARKRAQVST